MVNQCSHPSPRNLKIIYLFKSHQLDGSPEAPYNPQHPLHKPLKALTPHLLQPANFPTTKKFLIIFRLLYPQHPNIPSLTRSIIHLPNRLPIHSKE